MNRFVRLARPPAAGIVAWWLSQFLSASPKVAVITGVCIAVFGYLSIANVYFQRRLFIRDELIGHYSSTLLASVIVSLIVRITHY
ncbi:hypothetical protein [Alicyclobacillus fodiniaquatilis]|jgi:hypothetical protein|uniref:Uncharacterized protein n=1 Tax=Alicyclobacillus fodiniaquatilis TaxID=1661150 RepID=A0ABW4JRN7_9BACL